MRWNLHEVSLDSIVAWVSLPIGILLASLLFASLKSSGIENGVPFILSITVLVAVLSLSLFFRFEKTAMVNSYIEKFVKFLMPDYKSTSEILMAVDDQLDFRVQKIQYDLQNELNQQFLESQTKLLEVLNEMIAQKLDHDVLQMVTEERIKQLIEERKIKKELATSYSHLFLNRNILDTSLIKVAQPISPLNVIDYMYDAQFITSASDNRWENVKSYFELLHDAQSEVVDIRSILAGFTYSLNFQHMNDDIKLFLKVPDEFPKVRTNLESVKKALGHLLSNAIKYSHPKGRINIEAKAENDKVIITISDTGIGIPSDEISSIFEPFYRGKKGRDLVPGKGLGLALTKQIIESSGGNIEISSKSGKGTLVSVLLPIESHGNKDK